MLDTINRYLREMPSSGATVRGLAKRFAVSEDALQRHKDHCSIEAQLSESEEILETMRAATRKALAEVRAEEDSKDSSSVQASISVQHPGGYQSRCKACNYPGHEDLDLDLLSGKLSDSGYAKIVGCSHKSIGRHRTHIAAEIATSSEAELVINADNLVDQLKEARERALDLLDKAIEAADTRVYGAPSQYLGEIRQQIKLMGELQGRLASQPQINIINNPEWVSLRTLIITTLDKFPEARQAVVDALP